MSNTNGPSPKDAWPAPSNCLRTESVDVPNSLVTVKACGVPGSEPTVSVPVGLTTVACATGELAVSATEHSAPVGRSE